MHCLSHQFQQPNRLINNEMILHGSHSNKHSEFLWVHCVFKGHKYTSLSNNIHEKKEKKTLLACTELCNMHGWIIKGPQASGLNVNVAQRYISLLLCTVALFSLDRSIAAPRGSGLKALFTTMSNRREPAEYVHWIVTELFEWRPTRH